MSQNNKYKKIPTTTATKSNFKTEIRRLVPYFAYLNLTISSIGATYRAYANNDMPMVAFLAFVVVSYFVIDICLQALNRSDGDGSYKKTLCLKIVVWVLTSAILFGFANRFRNLASFHLTVLVFFAVGCCSACIFFVYFVRDDNKKGRSNCNNNNVDESV